MEKTAGSVNWRKALLSGVIGSVLFLLLVFVLALLYEKGTLGQGREVLLLRAALVLSAFLAARLACRRERGKLLPHAAISGGVVILMVIIICMLQESTALFNMSVFVDLLCVICGALLAGLLRAQHRPRRRRRRR